MAIFTIMPGSETSTSSTIVPVEKERLDDRAAQEQVDIESRSLPQRSRWSSAIETFSPTWFAICMNTGLFGILLRQFPYKFPGSNVISTFFWVGDVVLFILFMTVQVVRFSLFPRAAWKATVSDMEELCFWGCAPIALVTIVAQIGLMGSNSPSWGEHAQHGFTIFAIVLWWFDTFWMLMTAYVVYYLIAKRRMAEKVPVPGAIFLPAVGTTTVGLVGGLITNNSAHLSARLAVPVIFMSYLHEGFGWWIAIIVFPVFLHDLFAQGFPTPAKLPTMMMLVGPAGQVGAALHSLGTASAIYFGQYDKGTFFQASFGQAFGAASKMLALLFLGFDMFWAIFVVVALVEHAIRRKLTLSMSWWTTIFPMGTLGSTFLLLANELDSPTFRTLTTGLYMILFTDYVCCWVMTIYLIYRGEVLDGRPKTEKTA